MSNVVIKIMILAFVDQTVAVRKCFLLELQSKGLYKIGVFLKASGLVDED